MADIFYICKQRNRDTIKPYLAVARQSGDPGVNLITYEQIGDAKRLRVENIVPASYVFTDMERARPSELRAAARMAQAIRACGPDRRVINDPTGVAEHFEFLRLMHLHGINQFNAYLLAEHQPPARFPVFVRTSGGRIVIDRLIENEADLEAAVYEMTQAGVRRSQVMIVEYQPTDLLNGGWVKYSAYFVAGEILPGQVTVAAEWCVRTGSDNRIVDTQTIELERDWLDNMRFREEIAGAFAIAGIEFGRIEFGIRDGRPQFWRIVTNPELLQLPRPILDIKARDAVMLPRYLPVMRRIVQRLAEAADDPA